MAELNCSTRELPTFQTFKHLLMILEQTQNVGIPSKINSLPSPLQDVHSIHKIKMYFHSTRKKSKDKLDYRKCWDRKVIQFANSQG